MSSRSTNHRRSSVLKQYRLLTESLTGQLAAAGLLIVTGCSPGTNADTEPKPRVPGAIVEFGELSIPVADALEFVSYFEQVNPQVGHKVVVREVLAQHLIPLAFARRDFPTERAHQLDLAQALSLIHI